MQANAHDATGRVVTARTRVIFVDEQDHALFAYFSREANDMAACVARADRSTHCPYKGDAVYWALVATPVRPDRPELCGPLMEVASLAGHMAFEQDRVEVVIDAHASSKPV